MTIAEAKLLASSERFVMARISARYLPTSSLWTAYVASSIYSVPVSQPVASVTYMGVAYTEVSSLGAVTTDTWYHDAVAGVLYVSRSTLPNSSSTNVVVIEVYLFVTETKSRYAGTDPATDPNGSHRYMPLIAQPPVFLQSFENSIAGVLTIADTSMTLINDGFFTDLLADDWSLSECDVVAWICISSISNCQRVYTGKVRSVSFPDEMTLNLTIVNALAPVDEMCLMGDPLAACKVNDDLLWASANAADKGKPIRFVAAAMSFIRYEANTRMDLVTATVPTFDPWLPADFEAAICTSYNPKVSTTRNRTWMLARHRASALRTQVFGTVLGSTALVAGDFRAIRFSSHNLKVGECIKWTDGVNTAYGFVLYTRTFTVAGSPYNCVILEYNSAGVTLNTANMVPHAKPAMFWDDAGTFRFISCDDIATVSTALTNSINEGINGPNYVTTVTLQSSTLVGYYWNVTVKASSNESTLGAINPSTDRIGFMIQPDDTFGVGSVVQQILEGAGISVDSASVTDFDAELFLDAAMSIPYVGDNDYGLVRDYAQGLLESAGGYLRMNAEGVAEIKALAPAAGGGTTITDDDVITESGVSVELDYEDVAYRLVPRNPHIPTWEPNSTSTADNPETEASDNYRRYFYRRSKIVDVTHQLREITSRIEYRLTLRGPRVIYQFEVSSKLIDLQIGDEITLQSQMILGGETSADLIVIAVNVMTDAILVRAVGSL